MPFDIDSISFFVFLITSCCFLICPRLKQRNETADMNALCDAVESDFAGVPSGPLRESVHSALGQLIKQRRVYYTGKGYFLVTPAASATDGIMSSPLIKGLGTRINHLRHSLRDRSPSVFQKQSPNGRLVDRECQTTNGIGGNDVTYAVVHKESGDLSSSPEVTLIASPQISPGSLEGGGSSRSFALERSQSLRVSKKSLRNMSKGGSLR